MNSFTPELIEKAKAAASVEELLELAKANNVELSAEDAAAYFAQLNPKTGELSDDDLDAVAGGGCSSGKSGHGVPNGTLVRVLTGKTCWKCGGNIGRIFDKNSQYSYQRIVCKEYDDGDVIIEASIQGFTLGVEFEVI